MPTRPAAKPKKPEGKSGSPYGYPFWEWVAREDPEYVRARGPLSALSIGEGKELSIKYREMVIIGILAFRGRQEGCVAHMRRAIEHGATKRELLEALQSAAVPGGGPTFSTGVQALMKLDQEGAFERRSKGRKTQRRTFAFAPKELQMRRPPGPGRPQRED